MVQLFKNHWFKIAIVSMLAYLLLKKDFSFRFNMNSKPNTTEETNKGKYTEKANLASRTENSSIFGLFNNTEDNLLAKRFGEIKEKEKAAFVLRFGKVARDEQQRYGIPASVILASALVQSYAGQRKLSAKGNNFFALRCTTDWEDKTQQEEDRCYRTYKGAWESFRDHSLFLQQHISLKKGNYTAWIDAIETTFDTGETYSSLLKNVIETYQLNELDDSK